MNEIEDRVISIESSRPVDWVDFPIDVNKCINNETLILSGLGKKKKKRNKIKKHKQQESCIAASSRPDDWNVYPVDVDKDILILSGINVCNKKKRRMKLVKKISFWQKLKNFFVYQN
jgi:hypothetical protein